LGVCLLVRGRSRRGRWCRLGCGGRLIRGPWGWTSLPFRRRRLARAFLVLAVVVQIWFVAQWIFEVVASFEILLSLNRFS
jgi:hypothetical protein